MDIINKEEIGIRIEEIRKQKKLSMQEFATLIGVSGKSTVNEWEKGRSIPSEDTLKKIAYEGGVTINWLLYGSLDNYFLNILKENAINDDELYHAIIRYAEISTNLIEFQNAPFIYDNDGNLIDPDLHPEIIKSQIDETILEIIEENKDNLIQQFKINNFTYGDDIKVRNSAITFFDNLAMSSFFTFEGSYHHFKSALSNAPMLSMGDFDSEDSINNLKKMGYSKEKIIESKYENLIMQARLKFYNELDELYNNYKEEINNL